MTWKDPSRSRLPTIMRTFPLRLFNLILILTTVIMLASLFSKFSSRIPQHRHSQMEVIQKVAGLPSLTRITIDEIATGLDQRRFSVVDLVNAHLARIDEVNKVFNAVLEVNPDALAIAHELDRAIKLTGRRGPLHGVPVLLKDNIYTQDELQTSAGSYAFLGARHPQEASVVARLRRAGAVILGKTNMAEFANFRSTNATNGWSPRGGQTYGAFVARQESEGSSSGSAVAVALGLAPVSLGTDTDSSIVLPAMKNGVIGFRPTTGLVPRDGVVPLSDRQDSVGPMARTVKDAAYVLSAIAGPSTLDNGTWSIPFDKPPDYLSTCQERDLKGLRIGYPRGAVTVTDSIVLAAFEKALEKLIDLGITVIDNVPIPSQREWESWDPAEKRRPLEAEFKSAIQRWCGTLDPNYLDIRNIDDLVTFVKIDPREDYPNRNVDRLLGAQVSPGVDAPETREALEKMLRCCGDEGLLAAIQTHSLDALVFPADYDFLGSCAARAGLPVFSLPLGYYPPGTPVERSKKGDIVHIAPNVPYGIAFSGLPYSELILTRIAHVFQNEWKLPQVEPYLLPRTELEDVQRARSRF